MQLREYDTEPLALLERIPDLLFQLLFLLQLLEPEGTSLLKSKRTVGERDEYDRIHKIAAIRDEGTQENILTKGAPGYQREDSLPDH